MTKCRHFILGTAGHIDHGKSSLVKALTGTDPDRLPEEKARGMTIELGFAHLSLPADDGSGDALSIGVVDVPGHADFVKHMVAGVGAIDLALFVVAADDGWMPQTEEHYQILHYLRVPHAIVALTKADLVDDLDLVREDLADHLKGGSWETIDIVPVSALTGLGLDDLRRRISRMLSQAQPPRDAGKPRLPVDRAFSPKGVGTVVTGTLTGGSIGAGTNLVVQPGGIKVHVRNVQAHSSDQEKVFPGTRSALNLTGVSVAHRGQPSVARGQVVTDPSLGDAVRVVDVLLEKSGRSIAGVRHATRALRTGREVMVHHGSSGQPARLHLLGRRSLEAGGTALAELRFAEPVYFFVGDRFVLRDASQGLTLAGGLVLDDDANRRMFRKPWQKAFLKIRAAYPDELDSLICSQLTRDKAVARSTLLRKSRFSEKEIGDAVADLVRQGILAQSGPWLFDGPWWKLVSEKAAQRIQTLHHSNPELPGLPVRDLRREVESDLPLKKLFDVLLDGLLAGEFSKAGACIRHRDHLPKLPADLEGAGRRLRAALAENLITPPNRGELAPGPAEQKALRFLVDTGEVIELDPKTVISAEGYRMIRSGVQDCLRRQGKATASELREFTVTSRRILMPLLERLDAEGLTVRKGDVRELRARS